MLHDRRLERARESFDLGEKAAPLVRELTAVGGEGVQIPGAVIALVRNLSKGRMKIGIELTGFLFAVFPGVFAVMRMSRKK